VGNYRGAAISTSAKCVASGMMSSRRKRSGKKGRPAPRSRRIGPASRIGAVLASAVNAIFPSATVIVGQHVDQVSSPWRPSILSTPVTMSGERTDPRGWPLVGEQVGGGSRRVGVSSGKRSVIRVRAGVLATRSRFCR